MSVDIEKQVHASYDDLTPFSSGITYGYENCDMRMMVSIL